MHAMSRPFPPAYERVRAARIPRDKNHESFIILLIEMLAARDNEWYTYQPAQPTKSVQRNRPPRAISLY